MIYIIRSTILCYTMQYGYKSSVQCEGNGEESMTKARYVNIHDAVGLVLSHDMTQIDVKTGYKGARFTKGQTIRAEDIPVLKTMGKETVSILELESGEVHEDDAALRLALGLAGQGVVRTGPEEGKITFSAQWNGLLAYDEESIHGINADPDWVLATAPNKVPVKKGEIVAGLRTVPLVMREEQVARAESCASPISVLPYVPLRTALVTTGREIVEGLVQDAFADKLKRKLAGYGTSLMNQTIVGDGRDEIAAAIRAALAEGAKVVITTGGMSVDPDDRTAGAIASVAGRVLFKGIPVIPGAHLMLALSGDAKIIGAPACAVFDEWTSLDLLLNRIFAGLEPSAEEVRRWGVGGLCRKCRSCNYPICAFAAR